MSRLPTATKRAPGCVAAALLVPHVAFACSGPGAMATIARNELIGWLSLGAAVLVSALVGATSRMRARGWRARWPLAIVLVLHPGWWMSARSGDCGFTLRFAAPLMTGVAILVAGALYHRARNTAP